MVVVRAYKTGAFPELGLGFGGGGVVVLVVVHGEWTRPSNHEPGKSSIA